MRILLVGCAVAALAAATASAQPAPPQPPAVAVPMHHQGGRDRVETRAELSADVARMFARVDSNGDGVVTTAEIEARDTRRNEGREHRAERKREKMEQRAARHDPAAKFARLDTNKDGKLVKAEVEAVHQARAEARGKTRDRAMHNRGEHLFERADTNRDGAITLAELQAMPRPDWSKRGMMHGAGMKGGMKHRLFGEADLNKDGQVTLAEAQAAAAIHFDRMDANRDGTVTREERKAMRRAMREQHNS